MDDRITEFVRGLRAANVRVSIAEALDAFQATTYMGVADRDLFRESLRATLIKEVGDFPIFDRLFPLYFGSGGPPLSNAMSEFTPDEQTMIDQALRAVQERTRRLLEWLTSGDGPTKEELEEMARRMSQMWQDSPQKGRWITRRMLQEMGFNDLPEQLAQLARLLQQMGMSSQSIANLMGVAEQNADALRQQVAEAVGLEVARDRAESRDGGKGSDKLHGPDIIHKSFAALSGDEKEKLREEVSRLVTQLRSRAALRRKQGPKGKFDPKDTVRSNLVYGGVPLQLKFKKRKLKPSLVLVLDVSNSMWTVCEFMLRLVHELHDQVSKVRSFAFYADLTEVDPRLIKLLDDDNSADSVFQSIRRTLPGGHYATDLGHSLDTFYHKYLSSVTGRTTVIIVGDGRNNYNNPRLELVQDLQRRAKQLFWFTPEPRAQWREGDSDMERYEPLCDQLFIVRNLAQLSAAVDALLTSA